MNRRNAWIGAAGAGIVLLLGLALLFGSIRLLTKPRIREVPRFTRWLLHGGVSGGGTARVVLWQHASAGSPAE